MTYKRLIIGDANVGRFWQNMQRLSPPLQSVSFSSAVCSDTFETSLRGVSDELDYVVVSVATSLILEEASSIDVRGSARNVLESMVKLVARSALRAKNCQVVYSLSYLKISYLILIFRPVLFALRYLISGFCRTSVSFFLTVFCFNLLGDVFNLDQLLF